MVDWIKSIGSLSGLTGEHRHIASYCSMATDEPLSNTMQRTPATDFHASSLQRQVKTGNAPLGNQKHHLG